MLLNKIKQYSNELDRAHKDENCNDADVRIIGLELIAKL